MVGARELPVAEAPLLHSTVERLAARAGVAEAEALPHPRRAAARARDGPRAARTRRSRVSSGSSRACPPAELEGVLAHELAHVRTATSRCRRRSSCSPRRSIELSRIGGWLAARAALRARAGRGGAACTCCSRRSASSRPTARAAELCESPHGLADALLRLEQAAELVEFQASPATEPLYTFNPFVEEGLAALFVTHPPVGERVRRLRELDPAWREKLRADAA